MARRDARAEWDDEDVALLLDGILDDAHGDDEQLWALRAAFEEDVSLPANAFVIAEPIEVVAVEYDGNTRRGLTAIIRRPAGGEHVVAVFELAFPERSAGARYVAAYRKWLGLEPPPPPPSIRRHKTADSDLDRDAPVELVVLAPKQRMARCRLLGTEREITLRSAGVWNLAPGEIITVHARKQWRHAGHPYLSGEVARHRLDVAALGLVPLRLEDEWPWDPSQVYWGEKDEPIEAWATPIIARGPRRSFEMEQVLPGDDPDNWDSGPILEASERHAAGDALGARELLGKMLIADLRCLDAHAHLGNFAFDQRPQDAICHYEVGLRIGELSLGADFDGVLPWGRGDNRPLLRCMHGFGLCLWRLGRGEEAAALFERMLWLNPADNQGIRFLLPQVRAGERWEDHADDR